MGLFFAYNRPFSRVPIRKFGRKVVRGLRRGGPGAAGSGLDLQSLAMGCGLLEEREGFPAETDIPCGWIKKLTRRADLSPKQTPEKSTSFSPLRKRVREVIFVARARTIGGFGSGFICHFSFTPRSVAGQDYLSVLHAGLL